MWKTSNRVNPRGHSKQRAHTETGVSESTNVVRTQKLTCTYRDWFIWQNQLGTNDVHIQRQLHSAAPTL